MLPPSNVKVWPMVRIWQGTHHDGFRERSHVAVVIVVTCVHNTYNENLTYQYKSYSWLTVSKNAETKSSQQNYPILRAVNTQLIDLAVIRGIEGSSM